MEGRASTVDLGDFIRRERSTIVDHWVERVRRTSVAHDQSPAMLVDHLPELLEAIAQNTDTIAQDSADSPARVALGRHASQRLEQGYGLAAVVEEYIELRACIFERLEELGLVIEPGQSRVLHRALDNAMRETARRYLSSHEKMLRAMDHFVGEPNRIRSVDQALDDILQALRETAGAEVDAVAILLVGDDQRLRVRASAGPDQAEDGFSQAIGEGFAGTIAATGQPMLLRDASHDRIVTNARIRGRGTRALYGVPLVADGHVIGVAYIGSCTANEFADEDMLLFRAMAERATAVIVRAQFVETLERTARFREQFIGILGHDLRSPLNAILGTAQFLMSKDQPPMDRLQTALPRIARSALRMERLISDLLDFTRARLGGGFSLSRTTFSLLDLAHEIVDEHRPLLSQRRLEMTGEDVTGSWDRARLAQVLSNLVGNAIEHSPDGAQIRVGVHASDGSALVEVWNEGEALPPGTKLFEPFERGTARGGGLGLGLYIAHEIVRAHGGGLAVRSNAGGTTFTVRLPFAVSASVTR